MNIWHNSMFWSCISQVPIDDDSSPIDASFEDGSLFQVGQTHYLNGSPAQNATTTKMPFLNEQSSGFFALFEGHRNGYTASHTTSALLHDFLQKEILLSEGSSLDMRRCFESAYSKADNHIKTVAADRGTSATGWVIRKHENKLRLYFSKVGCSRALLCRGSTAVCLTEDHTLSNEEEKRRLEACKAYANSCSGVRQLVPTTRAIGDHLLKGWVSSRPHYKECDLSSEDTFIVCTTQNISQVISDEEILAFAAVDSAQGLADRLVSEAADRGAQGCLSALAVRLDWGADGSRRAGRGSGGSWRSLGRRSHRSSASSRGSTVSSSGSLGSARWGSWLERP